MTIHLEYPEDMPAANLAELRLAEKAIESAEGRVSAARRAWGRALARSDVAMEEARTGP